MHSGRAVTLDQQPSLFRSGRKGCASFGRRVLNAALTNDVETHLAGRADHQLTAHWHRHRRSGLRAFRPGAGPRASPEAAQYKPAE